MIEHVLCGREMATAFAASVDVVVVGSGAGGAVVARELARDGRSVIVVEEGGYFAPAHYAAMTPSNTFRRMAREASLGAAVGLGETPLIAVLSGKCVGGSSALTGGVCFRVPEEVQHGWVHDLEGSRAWVQRRLSRTSRNWNDSSTSKRSPAACVHEARSSSPRARRRWAFR